MNARDQPVQPQLSENETESGQIRFSLESFQSLGRDDLLVAQLTLGHGADWGIWSTPVNTCPSRLGKFLRVIDFDKRIRDYLAKGQPLDAAPEEIGDLIAEGILEITRLALLMRLAPTCGIAKSKHRRLKPSSLAQNLYNYWPNIVATAIRRKASCPDACGLLSHLREEDVAVLRSEIYLRVEYDRLYTLATRGFWTDLPPNIALNRTTDPKGTKPAGVREDLRKEFLPISDKYLEEFGPRNLWLIKELGPHLLPLLEDLATYLETVDWSGLRKPNITGIKTGIIPRFIAQHLKTHPWLNRNRRPIEPSFPLVTGAKTRDAFRFPPQNWDQLKVLSASLQSAHLFLTLLAAPGRLGEIASLSRTCVSTERDGKDYVRGWTYKLTTNLFGNERTWPAPEMLVLGLGQQARLAAVWGRLPPKNVQSGLPKVGAAQSALWLSLGAAQTANAAEPLKNYGGALQALAARIGMEQKPDGVNLHPHRLRKTIGRLAGIALFNSPTALKRLFGHKNIEMTLHYILCDQDIRAEAETVLRELRILHCAETMEEIHEALALGEPVPEHSGGAASRMVDAVSDHQIRLSNSGRVWNSGSAYDLAYILTSSGQGWRFIQKNIVCAKVPGEGGLCTRNRGEPDTSKCDPACDNRIVLARQRRDSSELIESYIEVAMKANDDRQFGVFVYSIERLLGELNNFPDIKKRYSSEPRFQFLLTIYDELTQ